MWNQHLFEGYVNYLATPSVHTPELDEYYKRLIYYDGDGILAAQTGDPTPELCARWNILQDVAKKIRDRQRDLYQGNPPKCPPYGMAKAEPGGEALRAVNPKSPNEAKQAKTPAKKQATKKRGGK